MMTDEKVVEILADYVAHRRCVSDLALRHRLSVADAKALLKGRTFAHIQRPKGFHYPWPAKWNRYELSTPEEWRAECEGLLRRYVEERWCVLRFADEAKVGIRQAQRILRGREWRTIPRPEGFEYPYPEHFRGNGRRKLTFQQLEEGLRLFYTRNWCVQQLADHLGITRPGASQIVRGKSYPEVPRPWSRLTRAELYDRSMVARWKSRRSQDDVHATGRGSEGSAAGTGAEG